MAKKERLEHTDMCVHVDRENGGRMAVLVVVKKHANREQMQREAIEQATRMGYTNVSL